MEPVGFSAGQSHLWNRDGRGYCHQWRVHRCPVGEIRRVARGSKGITGVSGGSRGGGKPVQKEREREREKVFIHFSTTTQVDRVKIWSGRWLGIFLGSMLKFDKRRSKYMGTIYYMVWQAKTGSFLPQQIEGFDYGKWVMQWTIKKWLTGFDQSQTGMHPEIDQETSKIGWSLGFFCDRGLCNRKILRLSPP